MVISCKKKIRMRTIWEAWIIFIFLNFFKYFFLVFKLLKVCFGSVGVKKILNSL